MTRSQCPEPGGFGRRSTEERQEVFVPPWVVSTWTGDGAYWIRFHADASHYARIDCLRNMVALVQCKKSIMSEHNVEEHDEFECIMEGIYLASVPDSLEQLAWP